MSTINYAPFVPGNLAGDFASLTSAYTRPVDQLSSLFKEPVLPSVNLITPPDLLRAKNIFTDAAINTLEASRSINAYASTIQSLIPVLTTKEEIIETLIPIVGSWKTINVDSLKKKGDDFEELFSKFLPSLDPVLNDVRAFIEELLVPMDPINPPYFYRDTLVELLIPRLDKVFHFDKDSAIRARQLATILDVPTEVVTETLFKVFKKEPIPPWGGAALKPTPITPESLATTIQNKIADPVALYDDELANVSLTFTIFANIIRVVAHDQKIVETKLRSAERSGEKDGNVTQDEILRLWKAAEGASKKYINAVAI